MFRKLRQIIKPIPKGFRLLEPNQLPMSLVNALTSNIYYTPKLQKIAYTEELSKYFRYLSRKDKIHSKDLKQMTENILTQYGAIHQLTSVENSEKIQYGITRDYLMPPNHFSRWHGRVDYQVWLGRRHFFPVMFCEQKINGVVGMAMALANRAEKCLVLREERVSGYSIVTTGNQWQMFKVYRNGKGQKTIIYEGRNRFRNLWEDCEMVETVFGLIEECLAVQRQDVETLKDAYNLIDEKRFMIQADTKEEAQKASPLSKLLLKYYKMKQRYNSK